MAAEARLRMAKPPIELPPGIPGVATPDRIFGLLEVEFGREAVEHTVASILAPAEDVDLSAHRAVLRLARGPFDQPRLVTTNFDRLFEMAEPNLPVHLPPKLDPNARGIVKLHGSVDAMHGGPEGDGFVLSGAAFGGAYVADGWAARTMRSLLERHNVVFLGYAADDPPMQYLLEGLKRIGAPTARAYAFQPGEETADRWSVRGVTAIPYEAANDHAALWDTLEAWADRVEDPLSWRSKIIDMARRGPRDLAPHERGQVAELISSKVGAQVFSSAEDPPPAEWICVFDRKIRFGVPGQEAPRSFSREAPDLDPFVLYGLDDDPVIRIDTSTYGSPSRNVPQDAWDGLTWTEGDYAELRARASAGYCSAYRHGIGAEVQAIPPRLELLESWFADVADEPAALWWWARRGLPRPSFRWKLALARDKSGGPSDAWIAWARLLECADVVNLQPDSDPSMILHRFQNEVSATGWTDVALRRFEDASNPRFRRDQDFSVVPPRREAGISRLAMVELDLDYRQEFWRIAVPDSILSSIVAALGRNLNRLAEVQKFHPVNDLHRLPPFVRHDDPSVNRRQYDEDLGGVVFAYCDKLDRLREKDRPAFHREVASWPYGSELFDRLRLWQSLDPERSDSATVSAILAVLPNALLWHSNSRRDALHVILKRWSDIDKVQRAGITERLVCGPDAADYPWAKPQQFLEISARQRLNAIGWLVREGVDLGINWEQLRDEWQSIVPDWSEGDVDEAVEGFVTRSGTVRTDTRHEFLLNVPIETIVDAAAERSGRTDELLVEVDSFLGLVQSDSGLACEAIRRSTADATARGHALRTLLNDAAKTPNRHPLEALVALLEDCPDQVLAKAGRAVGHWVERNSQNHELVPRFDSLLDRLVQILSSTELPDGTYDDDDDDDPDYVFRAINATAGDIAETMMVDPRLPNVVQRTGLPKAWRGRAEALIALPRPHGIHALTIFSRSSPYLHFHDRHWVEQNILVHLEGPRCAVVLAGLSSYRKALPPTLFAKVRSRLTAAVKDRSRTSQSLVDWIAAQFLFAWIRDDGSLSDDAFEAVARQAIEPFRLAVLSYVRSTIEESHDRAVLDRIAHLLQAVWPRQAALQTEPVLIGLIDVALAGCKDVPRLSAIVVQHLRSLPDWPEIHRFQNLEMAAAHHPLEVLTILNRIAPADATRRVYGFKKVVDMILKSAPNLARDPRVEKLRRVTE
jgi:hypothetical protein